MSDVYPTVRYGRDQRLPLDGKRRCGSSCAHANCKFAGTIDAYLNCGANAQVWSDCPYHASGFVVTVYEDEKTMTDQEQRRARVMAQIDVWDELRKTKKREYIAQGIDPEEADERATTEVRMEIRRSDFWQSISL